jgi:predicted nucleotidyltransferase
MIPLVVDNLDQIASLCRRYRIRSLDLFGSAATGEFDPEASDIDLICDLGEYEPGVADRLFAFADALEALLGRKVDLLTVPMIRNPYFRQAIDEQRVRLYETGDREAAA